MGEFNLEEFVKFSKDNAVLTTLCDTQKARLNFLCLEENQIALEDTKDKAIVIINTGRGSVITEQGEQKVEEGTLMIFERDEVRSLKAETKLTAVLAIIPGG